MHPVRALLLTALSAAFVATGLFVVVRGGLESAPLGYGVIAFFGACAVICAMQLAPRERAQLDNAGGLSLRPDKIQTIGFIVGGAGLAVGCFFMAPLAAANGRNLASIAAYVGVAFFGFGALAGVWRLARPRDIARIDGEGVQMHGPQGWTLAWRDVDAITVLNMGGQRFIKLESRWKPPSQTMGGFVIGPDGTRLTFESLHALMIELWEQAARN